MVVSGEVNIDISFHKYKPLIQEKNTPVISRVNCDCISSLYNLVRQQLIPFLGHVCFMFCHLPDTAQIDGVKNNCCCTEIVHFLKDKNACRQKCT